jgi:integrase
MKFRIGLKIENILNEYQVQLLLKQALEMNNPWYLIWLMALCTGMRNGELFALDWAHVFLDEKRIVVARTWNKIDGFKNYPKNGDHRVVEISNSLLEQLKIQREKNPDSTFVLPRLDRWERGEQARDLRMFLSGLGLPTVRFHDLRATWATILLTKNVPPIKVMVMGGWKDIKTMGRYIRKAGVEIKGITDALPF